jgi:hypothetical protein
MADKLALTQRRRTRLRYQLKVKGGAVRGCPSSARAGTSMRR